MGADPCLKDVVRAPLRRWPGLDDEDTRLALVGDIERRLDDPGFAAELQLALNLQYFAADAFGRSPARVHSNVRARVAAHLDADESLQAIAACDGALADPAAAETALTLPVNG